MLEGLIQEKYSRVIVTHTDRLSMDEIDSAELKEIFVEKDIFIETPDSIIDLSDENQELMMIDNFEEMEIEKQNATFFLIVLCNQDGGIPSI
jgi:DNA invertase Pin-like site-specific DNA recombinase